MKKYRYIARDLRIWRLTWQSDLRFVFQLTGNDALPLQLAQEALIRSLSQFVFDKAEDKQEQHRQAQAFISHTFMKNAAEIGDLWATCSLEGCAGSPGIDVKSIVMCRRPYQFSIDSFFIELMDMAAPWMGSYYGDVGDVATHLLSKIVVVHENTDPVFISGGGLFKYACLVSQGYSLAPWLNQSEFEQCMCARFCVDHPAGRTSPRDMHVQCQSLNSYLNKHFSSYHNSAATDLALAFLNSLHTVLLRACPAAHCRPLLRVLSTAIAAALPTRRPSGSSRLPSPSPQSPQRAAGAATDSG